MEDYRTVRGTATGEYEEKKSRFIAQLSFADSEEAAVAFLEQVRAANRTARHNVYAYRLRAGNRERYSDDGEPAKTAGTPALEVLQHSGLTDLIVVVTRYFGGVLLGTGGLVRAYTTATARALENAEVVTVRSVVELQVTVTTPTTSVHLCSLTPPGQSRHRRSLQTGSPCAGRCRSIPKPRCWSSCEN